jgi:tetratricopeptide (TPR) repeat protein
MTKATQFDSAGFDLDALSAQVSSLGDDVVMELHADGSTSCSPSAAEEKPAPEAPEFLKAAEQYKQQGNDYYKQQNYKLAHEKYTEAILSVPGPSGADILLRKKEWEEEQHMRLRRELRERDAQKKEGNSEASNTVTEEASAPPPVAFVLDPPPAYGATLAVYYGNRAAASLQMAPPPTPPGSKDKAFPKPKTPPTGPLQEALDDCTVALLLDPSYVKAYTRRSTIYERWEQTEDALADMRQAQLLDPTNTTIRKQVLRLQRLEEARVEALKEETMAKLKDLGNSLLSNFGLSLDNFQAQKDPNTGSYNISFQQN